MTPAPDTAARSALRGIPHADRHCHSLTSAPFAALRELAPDAPPPPLRFASFAAFDAYLRALLVPAVRDLAAVRALTRAALQRLVADGATAVEMSFDLTVPDSLGVTLEQYCDAIRAECARMAGVLDVRPEAGFDRSVDPVRATNLLRRAVRADLFRSIDLYGDERAAPAGRFVGLYRNARAAGLIRKAHVGEFGTADEVLDAVEALDLQAVQHGVTAAGSAAVLDALRQRGVTLHLAPQSNVALGVVPSMAAFPLRPFLDAGVRVTVASDDFTVFGASVPDQLVALVDAGACTATEATSIARASLTGPTP